MQDEYKSALKHDYYDRCIDSLTQVFNHYYCFSRFTYEQTARIKVHELRGKSKADLEAQLKELKNELAALRVAKVCIEK